MAFVAPVLGFMPKYHNSFHTASLALLYVLLSFSLLLTAVCGAGDLAHTVSTARFCLLLSFSLLMSAVCGAGDLAHTASLAPLYVLLSFFPAVDGCVWRW